MTHIQFKVRITSHLVPALEFVQVHDELGTGMDPLKIKSSF